MAERADAGERLRVVGWRVWLWWVLASTLGWAVGGAVLGPVFGVIEPAFGAAASGAAVGVIGGRCSWGLAMAGVARAPGAGRLVDCREHRRLGCGRSGVRTCRRGCGRVPTMADIAATVGAGRLVGGSEHGRLGPRGGHRLVWGCRWGCERGHAHAPGHACLGYRRACGWSCYRRGAGVAAASADGRG